MFDTKKQTKKTQNNILLSTQKFTSVGVKFKLSKKSAGHL